MIKNISKNILSFILLFILSLSLFACTELSIPSTDKDNEIEKDEEVVYSPEVEDIKNVYLKMTEQYNLKYLEENQDKDFGFLSKSSENIDSFGANLEDESQDKNRSVASSTNSPLLKLFGFDINNLSSTYVDYFNILKDKVNLKFDRYCGTYAELDDEPGTYVYINKSEEYKELQLAIKSGDTYLFYSNYYLDEDCNKQIEYKEGYKLLVEVEYINYTVENNKACYPIRYGMAVGGGYDNFILQNDDDLLVSQIAEYYDMLKYPFYKHLSSEMITKLLSCNSTSFEDQKEFRELAHETLYKFYITGKFNFDGLNYKAGDISVEVSDKTITLLDDTYKIATACTNLFTAIPGGIYCTVLHTTITYKLVKQDSNGYTYEEITKQIARYYKLSTDYEIVSDGVVFTLVDSINLDESECAKEEVVVNDTNKITSSIELQDESAVYYISYDNNLIIGYYITLSDGNLMQYVDLPRYDEEK